MKADSAQLRFLALEEEPRLRCQGLDMASITLSDGGHLK